jgi:hypothetical protein
MCHHWPWPRVQSRISRFVPRIDAVEAVITTIRLNIQSGYLSWIIHRAHPARSFPIAASISRSARTVSTSGRTRRCDSRSISRAATHARRYASRGVDSQTPRDAPHVRQYASSRAIGVPHDGQGSEAERGAAVRVARAALTPRSFRSRSLGCTVTARPVHSPGCSPPRAAARAHPRCSPSRTSSRAHAGSFRSSCLPHCDF